MSTISAEEQKILRTLDQLSPNARREALRRLLFTSSYLERAVDRNQPRIAALAQERGLDWDTLPEQQREQLLDELLHE